jgi:hypothetical protein
MRVVEDGDGNRYLLEKRSSEASRVRDPATGERRHLPNDQLSVVDGESPLATAASAVPPSVRKILRVAGSDAALGLLVELDDRGPLAVRTLLDAYDLCESDLHGLLAELRVAGVIEETTVAGERGYALTGEAREGLAVLRE